MSTNNKVSPSEKQRDSASTPMNAAALDTFQCPGGSRWQYPHRNTSLTARRCRTKWWLLCGAEHQYPRSRLKRNLNATYEPRYSPVISDKLPKFDPLTAGIDMAAYKA